MNLLINYLEKFLFNLKLIIIAGAQTAITNDQNNKLSEIKPEKRSFEKRTPTKILLEKSALGNSSRPKNTPVNMDMTDFLSLRSLL